MIIGKPRRDKRLQQVWQRPHHGGRQKTPTASELPPSESPSLSVESVALPVESAAWPEDSSRGDSPPAESRGLLVVSAEESPAALPALPGPVGLPADLWQQSPHGHQFSWGAIYLALKLVLSGSGLRAAARILQWLLPACGLDDRAPTYQTLRLWVLRLGLWELTRSREPAEDWIWIIDHTQQLGDKKVLLIVGLRLTDWRPGEPLTQRDLSLLALEPVTSATGEGLCEVCQRLVQRTGVPRAIVSDGARDLRCGVNLLRDQHPGVAWIYDIKHFTAAALKHELEDDPQWKEFTAAANRTKQQCSVTALAALCPPQQRGKARYLNLQELVSWGTKMLAGLDQPAVLAAAQLDPEQCRAKLGWLEGFRQPLAHWAAAMQVIAIVESQVRRVGLHRRLVAELEPQLAAVVAGPLSERLRDRLLAHLAEQAEQVQEQRHLPASSEVLESLIGSYKYLAGEHGQHGVTSLVLGIGTLLIDQLPQTLPDALHNVSNASLATWCRKQLGPTVQSCRRQLSKLLPTGTKSDPSPTPS